MRRFATTVLSMVAVSAALGLTSCQGQQASPPGAAPGPPATSTGATPAATAGSSSGAAAASPGGDVASICAAADTAIQGILQKVFDHPNDPRGAAPVYADGAKQLRAIGAGTPLEPQLNMIAATMESIARRASEGRLDSDTSELPKAGEPLAKACGD